ncbi:MAG: hypothetical protein B6I38_07400 [Anaerolineaceae bacterium 4572_5.1]|nr:MAG: hypothetical protein B6I38_07400 [Anaerolineaceae bacterium 4572_5.1]
MLKNSGEMGRGVYHMFLAMDESDEIEIKFTSSSTASGRTPTKMTLGGWLWAKDPNPYSTAVFAHEFTHMVQASGDPHGNFSVASELEARIVEYYIKVELGHELSTSDKKIFELYDKNPDISKEDLKQFRNDYLLNGNLWWPENLGTSLAWMVYRFEPLTQGVGDFVLIQTFKLMGAHFSAESTAPAVPTGRKNMDIYIR